jgi:hypothetical protein
MQETVPGTMTQGNVCSDRGGKFIRNKRPGIRVITLFVDAPFGPIRTVPPFAVTGELTLLFLSNLL